MIPYTELQQTFIRQLQTAVTDYQARFVQRRMPAHRAADIAAITELLHDTTDIESLKAGIRGVLIQFKTGWFIFSTGNSRLREAIQSQLNAPQYSSDAFLKSRILELEQTTRELARTTPLERLFSGYAALTPDEAIQAALSDAQRLIALLRDSNQTLSRDNERLGIEMKALVTENQRLHAQNHRLSAKCTYQRYLGYVSGDDTDSLSDAYAHPNQP